MGNIRKRLKLEYDYIPEEGADIPEPEEMETEEAGMEELGVYLEGGEYLSIYMDGDDILADETIRAAIQEDAMLRGYNDLDTYMQDNVTGIARAADGGIPERYKKKGFRKVGVKKRAPSGAKHKWEVLAKKKVGGKTRYKIVKGGYRGMQDFKSHKDSKRKKRFWDRMGGRNSSKAKDPFSPLYWHKRFGTWEDGGDFKFEPHMMYHPETGQAVEATTYEQHLGLGRQGYTHEPRGGRNIYRNQDATGVASDQRSREIASQRAQRGFRASDLDYYIDDIFIGFNDNRDEDTTISAMTNGRAENRDQLRSLVLTDGLSAVASDLGIGREEIAQLPTDALIYLIDYKLNTGKDVRDLLLRADQDITVTQLQSKKPNVQLYEDNKEDLLNKLNNFTLSYGVRPALEDAYKTLPGESGESYSVNNPNPKYTNVYGDRVNYISTARLNQAVENSDLTEGTPAATGTTQGRTEDGLYYSGYSTSDIQKDDQGEYITTPQGDRINILTDETTGLKYYDENLAPQTYSSSSDIGAFQPARYTRQDMLPEAEEKLKAEYNKFFDDLEVRQAEGKDITGTFNVYGFSSPEPVNENLWSQLGNASSSEEANDFLAEQRAKTSRGIFEEIAAERGIDISGLNIVEKGISERGYAGDLEGYADYDPELKGDGYLGQRGFGFDYTATTPDSRKAYLETPSSSPPPPGTEPDPQYQPQRGGMDFPVIDYMSRLPRPITNFMTTGLNLLPYREAPDVKLSEEAALVANAEALGNAIDVSTQNIGAQTNAALAQLTRNTGAANNQAVVETNKANAQIKQQADILS